MCCARCGPREPGSSVPGLFPGPCLWAISWAHQWYWPPCLLWTSASGDFWKKSMCFILQAFQSFNQYVLMVKQMTHFCFFVQPYEENPALLYSSPHARGVIQPYSTEQIPLVLQAKTVDSLQETAHIAILGHRDPPLVSVYAYYISVYFTVQTFVVYKIISLTVVSFAHQGCIYL